MTTKTVEVRLRSPHPEQEKFLSSVAKGKVIRAGRRGGKTVGAGVMALKAFLSGKRVLYTAPTGEQTDAFWREVTKALNDLCDGRVYKKNETERYIEKVGTENRIKAKTAWNADSLRGDYADLLIFDEWQLTAEDAWEDVGAPMLMDNNGDAVFIYTPPSLKSSGVSKALDHRHASKMFKDARDNVDGKWNDWEVFHFTSYDNPHVSVDGLDRVTRNMSRESYLKEILAEDDDEQLNLLVYGCWDERICKIGRFEVPGHWFVYTGHDFGSANPGCLFVAEDPTTGFLYCFKEYAPTMGKSTYENVQAFNDMSKGYDIRNRVGGNVTTEEEIRQGYAVQGWSIIAPYVTKVNMQIDKVKQLMEKNKLFIFSDMHKTLEQMNSCMWKLDDYGKPTNKIRNEEKYHLLACLRYVCSIFNTESQRERKGAALLVW